MQKPLKFLKSYWLEILFILLLLITISSNFSNTQEDRSTMSTPDFYTKIEKGEVDYIVVKRNSLILTVKLKDGTTETTANLNYDTFLRDLADRGVEDIRTEGVSTSNAIDSVIYSSIMLLFFYLLIKGGRRLFTTINKAISKSLDGNEIENRSVVTFADVAGMSEEKQELLSAIESIRNSEKLSERGMKPVRGVLLEGPPGVGKTLLAKAIAGEAGVSFLSYSGSGFAELYIGVGPARVRQMYTEALKKQPCVVFIDEIDSIGARRIEGGGASREANNTLTALLEIMDGIGSAQNILFIGSTNRVDALDPALTRPGRFDKVLHIGAPNNKKDREEIVAVHMKGKQFSDDTNAESIAKLCYGLTGAEIASVLNDAVMVSFTKGDDGVISLPHIDEAIMKLQVKGVAKGKHSPKTMKRVAYHELGHALMHQAVGEKVLKVAVQPYSSGVGGVTVVNTDHLEDGLQLLTTQDLKNRIKVLYAGMVAEEVMLGDYSIGNSNDLEQATKLLHTMVAYHGMGAGNILSSAYLGNFGAIGVITDEIRNRMEQMGHELRLEVQNYFALEEVKQRIEELSERLITEGTIYNLEYQRFSFNADQEEPTDEN